MATNCKDKWAQRVHNVSFTNHRNLKQVKVEKSIPNYNIGI